MQTQTLFSHNVFSYSVQSSFNKNKNQYEAKKDKSMTHSTNQTKPNQIKPKPKPEIVIRNQLRNDTNVRNTTWEI